MATKPTAEPRWAETGAGTPSASITEPSSGEKDVGFQNGTASSAEKINWILWLIYKWCEYLNDGALSGNHTIDGTFGVTGAVDFDSTLLVNGAVDFDSTLNVDGLITAQAGVTAAANQHVTVSGTGAFKHGDRTLILPAGAGLAAGDAAATSRWAFSHSNGGAASCWTGAGTGTDNIMTFAIPLCVGDRIKEVRAFVQDTAGSNTVSMQVRKSSNTNTSTQLGTTQTSAGGGTNQTLAVTGLTETLASTEYVHVNIAHDTATDTTNRVYGVEVVYDHP
jgi:hypothetical protein